MKPFKIILLFGLVMNGACSLTPAGPPGDAPAMVRFQRSWLSGADAVECVVVGDQLILSATIARSGKKEYFRRSLSKDQMSQLDSAIRGSGLLKRSGEGVYPNSTFAPLQHSDGVVDTYEFPAWSKNRTAQAVSYHGVYDEAANTLLGHINKLLPPDKHLPPLPAR